MIEFRLKDVLKEKNIRMRELAEKTGLSTNTLSMLSTGKSKGIQFETLDKILTATKTDIGDLIHHSGIYLDLSVGFIENVSEERRLKFTLFFSGDIYVLEIAINSYNPNNVTVFEIQSNPELKKQEKFLDTSVLQLINILIIKELYINDKYDPVREVKGMLLFDWSAIAPFGVGFPADKYNINSLEEVDDLVYEEARKFPNIKIREDVISIPYSSIDFVISNREDD